MPQNIRPYSLNDKNKCMWNYLAINDIANGAAIIGKTQVQKIFCGIIKSYGIKYCEDMIYRLMTFYGIIGCYFPKSVICYEYGTGISSSRNNIWQKRKNKDLKNLIQIMLDERNNTDLQKQLLKAYIKYCKKGKIRKIFIKGKLFLGMKRYFRPRLTSIPINNMMDVEIE